MFFSITQHFTFTCYFTTHLNSIIKVFFRSLAIAFAIFNNFSIVSKLSHVSVKLLC